MRASARFGGGRSVRTARRATVVASTVTALLVAGGTFAAAVPDLGNADGTPCSEAARACVDLEENRAWLLEDGKVVHGPVPIAQGENQRTPTGIFQVQWKNKDHHSSEFDVPMPYAIFFAPGGIAFHEGNIGYPSAGCVRLRHEVAVAFWEHLSVGDEVQLDR